MQITEEMYFFLFNAITDATRLLDMGNHEGAKSILMSAQLKTEEMYING